jgi:hypothetical protein
MNMIELPGEVVSSSWLEVVHNGGFFCHSLDEVFALCRPSGWRFSPRQDAAQESSERYDRAKS